MVCVSSACIKCGGLSDVSAEKNRCLLLLEIVFKERYETEPHIKVFTSNDNIKLMIKVQQFYWSLQYYKKGS